MLAHINSFDFPFAFLMDSFPSPTSRNETSCATKFFTWFRSFVFSLAFTLLF